MGIMIETGEEHIKRITGKTSEEIKKEETKKATTAKKKREEEAAKKPGYQKPTGSTTKAAS